MLLRRESIYRNNHQLYNHTYNNEHTFLHELIKCYKKRSVQEDNGLASKLNHQVKQLKSQNEALIQEVNNLRQSSSKQKLARERDSIHREKEAIATNNDSMILQVHDKWINFSYDTIILAKKILSHSESLIATKNDKLIIDEYRKNIDSFESFLIMSKEDIQSIKQRKNIGPHIENSGAPQGGRLTQLDMKKIKDTILSDNSDIVCCTILQALRYRIIKTTSGIMRRSFIIQLVSNDFLNHTFILHLLDKRGHKVIGIYILGQRIYSEDDRCTGFGICREKLYHTE